MQHKGPSISSNVTPCVFETISSLKQNEFLHSESEFLTLNRLIIGEKDSNRRKIGLNTEGLRLKIETDMYNVICNET